MITQVPVPADSSGVLANACRSATPKFGLSRLSTLWLAVVATAASLTPAWAGLVGHWAFDEGSGTTITDSSGQNNHGILVNPKPGAWTSGVSGGALYFDGTTGAGSQYVTIPDAASLHATNAISFAAWVRCDDINRDGPIVAKEGDGQLAYWFGTFGPRHFGVLLDSDGNQPWSLLDRDQGSIPGGLWVHLASTWDGTTLRHYLNGVALAETAAFSGPLHASTGPLILGANVPYNSTAYKGAVDDLRIYNHALSAVEIQALVGTPPMLVGHWSFDEGGGTNIWDQSSQANHGTIINLRSNTWTTGIAGGALYFPGIVEDNSTYVRIPDSRSLRIAGDITFAAWVRCDDLMRDAPILAKEGDGYLSYWFGTFGLSIEGAGPGNFGILLDADGNQPWSLYDRNQGAVPLGQWAHLASVREGTTVRHYLNGESLGDTGGAFIGPINISDAFLAIGVNSLYNYTAFKGAVDEVRLYNYALTAGEIRELYLGVAFRITALRREDNDLRLTWACVPGRSYVVQTTPQVGAGEFADITPPIAIPADFTGTATNYVHRGALTNATPLFYRIKLLP